MNTLWQAIRTHYLLSLLVGSVMLSEALLTGLIPYSKGYLYGILSASMGPVWIALLLYFLNLLILEVFQAVKPYVTVKLALKARYDRTIEVLRNCKDEISNTPQRIQDDIKLSYCKRFEVIVEFIISGLILIQLIIVNLDVPLLILGALVYAAASIYIAIKFNPILKQAEIVEQQEEANFRTMLVQNLSPTGIYGANKATKMAAYIRMKYHLFTKTQIAILSVLPYVVLIPLLFNHTITFGILIQHSTTFSLLVVNASILLYYYLDWIKGTASEYRINELTK